MSNSWDAFLPARSIVMTRRRPPEPLSQAEPAVSLVPDAAPEMAPEPQVVAPAGTPAEQLAAIAAELAGCPRCKLCQGRKTVVVGEGNPQAELMFVGEGPGEQEDQQG